MAGKSDTDSEQAMPRRPPLSGTRSQAQVGPVSPRGSVVYTNTGLKSPPPPPPTVESQLADIRQMIKNLTSSVDSCRDSLNRKIDSLEQNIQAKITAEIRQLQDYVDMNISQVCSKVEALEKKVDAIEEQHLRQSEYNTEVTIVARGLSYEEGENLKEKATMMLRHGLGIHDVPVVNAKRMRAYGNKPGVVKVQLQSLNDKKKVLRAKMKLKHSDDFSGVYLNPSHTHTERIMDMNFRTLLNKIPGCENMRLTAHGKLVTRGQNRGNHEQQGGASVQ